MGSIFAWLNKEFREWHFQRLCQAIKQVDGRVFGLALEPAHIGSIHFGVEGESFLRNSAFDANPSQVPGYQTSPCHAGRQPFGSLLNHWI